MKRLVATWTLVVWMVVACGEVLLVFAARGVGSGLRPADPGSWPAWVATRPPDAVVFAVLRLAGVSVGAYLLVVLTIGAAVRLGRLRPVVPWSDRLTPSVLRSLLDRSLGAVTAGAVAVAVTVGPAAPAVAGERPPITLRGLPGPERSTAPTTTTTVPAPPPEPVREEPVAFPVEPVAEPPPVSLPSPAPLPALHVPPPAPPAPSAPALVYEPAPAPAAGRTWLVQRGDHFWSIARRVLAEAWNRPPAAHEVAPFWRALVADNRSRLADPDNPDLLFAGQVLTVPAVGSPPG